MLRRYLFVLGAGADHLDDLIQDVFTLALEKQIEDRGERATGTWLRRAAKNLLLRQRHSRTARREVEVGDEVWQQAHDELAREDERVDALRRCLGQLPERQRALLARAYRDGAGRRELAAEFAMAPDGIKTILRRLRAALASCVERRLGASQ